MHYLIYLPDCTPQDEGVAKRMKLAGLTDHMGDQDVLPNAKGPGSEIGCMVGWPTPQNPQMHYQPTVQTWIPSVLKSDGKPLYYVGISNEKPPQENELRRKYTQAGDWVQFGKQRWKLPTPDTVDSRAMLQDDGSYKWEVIREFSWMCDEREQLHAAYLNEFGVRSMVFKIEPSAQIEWLVKLLRVNYRLTPEVASHLEMWVGKEHLLDTFLMTLGLSRKVDDNA